MTTKFKKGFTLIELLVVIAIIGILSSIVLGSLSSARTKGEDVAIQATLANMKGQAEIWYADNNDYGAATSAFDAVCPAAPVVEATAGMFGVAASSKGLLALSTDLVAKAGSGNTNCQVTTNGTAWAAAAVLKSDTSKVTCVDSTGATKTSSTTIANSITAAVCQ